MIVNIKLKDGSDLIGEFLEDVQGEEGSKCLLNPIKVGFDHNHSMTIVMYGVFAKDGKVTIPKSEYVYAAEASDTAIEKYASVLEQMVGDDDDTYYQSNYIN